MSAHAMHTAAEFVQQLAQDLSKGDLELPVFPDSVVRIQRAFSSPDTNIDDIIRIISSDPALAARVLQLANSAAMRTAVEISDVRQAVVRMGHKLVQSSAVAFALRQAERNEKLTPESKEAFQQIWKESIEIAALCHVLTKKHTKLSADEAMLTGLLSVIGRLYIFMKAQDYNGMTPAELEEVLADWHPAISKAIAESWGMSPEMVEALETQLDSDPPLKEKPSLSEVLASAKLLLNHWAAEGACDASPYPVLQRLGIAGKGAAVAPDQYAEDVNAIRQGLVA